VKTYIPLIVFIVVVGGLLVFSARARRRQAQVQLDRAERIAVGTDVMTTSGLYGTVVARNADDTVLLAIAPGVEVRWALAALRDVADLPDRYRPAETSDADSTGDESR
jgi:preprotein translocase subunit YajC